MILRFHATLVPIIAAKADLAINTHVLLRSCIGSQYPHAFEILHICGKRAHAREQIAAALRCTGTLLTNLDWVCGGVQRQALLRRSSPRSTGLLPQHVPLGFTDVRSETKSGGLGGAVLDRQASAVSVVCWYGRLLPFSNSLSCEHGSRKILCCSPSDLL